MAEVQGKLEGQDLVAADEVRSAKDALLASATFRKSPRMSRLLDYLVEQALKECARDTSEYAIGIGVFDRDPRYYSPGEDPVVRVQVGRLRAKLKHYYAVGDNTASLEIVVPLGCYMPVFRRLRPVTCGFEQGSAFSICPFRCVAQAAEWECFALGLHEELTHLLYKNLGRRIIVEPVGTAPQPMVGGHRLEGSVHVDAQRVRTSVRLIETATGCVTWSEQFNGEAYLEITHQEALASSICQALQAFLGASQQQRMCLRL